MIEGRFLVGVLGGREQLRQLREVCPPHIALVQVTLETDPRAMTYIDHLLLLVTPAQQVAARRFPNFQGDRRTVVLVQDWRDIGNGLDTLAVLCLADAA